MRDIVFIVAIALASPASAQMYGVIDDRPALDPRDRQLFAEALNKAMVHQTGSVSEWNDPASQTHGQVLTGENYERKAQSALPSITPSSLTSKCGPIAGSLAKERMGLGQKTAGCPTVNS
jgi:hypothetical protein